MSPLEHDPYQLDRFLDGQSTLDGQLTFYQQAVKEMESGEKRGHWMWFVFPQIAGLGKSETSARYSIKSLEEAAAYIAHSTLGPRLIQCVNAVNSHHELTAVSIFGSCDAEKYCSSLTLFEIVAVNQPAVIQFDCLTAEVVRVAREAEAGADA